MWIRSQDKKDLINSKNLGIRKRLNEHVVVSISECGDFYPLGSYSSEEKALMVMDELQEEAWVEKKTYVYQMPVDDEVVTVKKRVNYAELRELEEKER